MSGFTFIEVMMLLVILSIGAAVAFQSLTPQIDAQRRAETELRQRRLAKAIAGEYATGGSMSAPDFGYVGDNGGMPSSLTALMTNPGGWSTWQGPYIRDNFSEATNLALQDAWGSTFSYSGGVYIRSSGSGANIDYTFAKATSDLTSTSITGTVVGTDGDAPGAASSGIRAYLTYPNGAGSTVTANVSVNAAGVFAFSGIPVGMRTIMVIDSAGADDSAVVTIPVLPRSTTSTADVGYLKMKSKSY